MGDLGAPLGPRFVDALGYAAETHAGQSRKGSITPYIAHLLGVASLTLEDAGRSGRIDESEAVGALLHDTAEDHGGEERLRDVAARFGADVAGIVRALSDSLEPEGEKRPWRERKAAYLARLADEPDPRVLRVSLADKLYNARAILRDLRSGGEAVWRRFNPGADPLWYYGELADLLSRRAPGPLADELAQVVVALRAEVEGAVPPIPGARWARPGRLLAGPHPGSDPERLHALGAVGVGLVVDLTGPSDELPAYDGALPAGVRHLSHPLAPGSTPARDGLEPVLDAVEAAVSAGEAVYVHCRGGGGRTAAVVDAVVARLERGGA